ncbi:MAG: hypothetical protein U1D06_06940, partial [Paracoccaceae bacterium]|nr:hypothetical protein [Paracoccaceae bacterium]
TSVLDGEKSFSKALDEALKSLKSGTITDIDAKVQVSVFTKLASLDGSADEALSYAKKLKPAFKKIEAKLK